LPSTTRFLSIQWRLHRPSTPRERAIPPEDYYEDYPQIENGVGLLRSMEEEFRDALDGSACRGDFCVATGMSAAPYMGKLLRAAGSDAPVYGIKNDFFGHTVDVAGLVTGRDLLAQLRDKPLRKRLLIPQVMLRHGGDVFLDDVTPAQVEQELGVKLTTVGNDGAALYKEITA
jgi:NifB/MoaA-like Fe-S oxidoreductase